MTRRRMTPRLPPLRRLLDWLTPQHLCPLCGHVGTGETQACNWCGHPHP